MGRSFNTGHQKAIFNHSQKQLLKMKKQFVLVHIDGGIPTFWTNDPSILVIVHNKDCEDDQEAYDEYMENDPVFDNIAFEAKDAEVLTPIEAKQLLDAPAIEENGEKQPDWQKEVDSVWKKRDIAVKWIEAHLPAGSTMRMESTINRLDSIRHTAGGLVLVNGPHGGITMPFWKLNALDVLRAAASVQKAILSL